MLHIYQVSILVLNEKDLTILFYIIFFYILILATKKCKNIFTKVSKIPSFNFHVINAFIQRQLVTPIYFSLKIKQLLAETFS